MQTQTNAETKPVNLTLRETTITLADMAYKKHHLNSRSAFADEAIRYYARRLEMAKLKKKLKDAYKARAMEEIDLATEWEPASLTDFLTVKTSATNDQAPGKSQAGDHAQS